MPLIKKLFNSLPNDKFLDWSKLNALADDKINVTEKLEFVLRRLRKHYGKSSKCWLLNNYCFIDRHRAD